MRFSRPPTARFLPHLASILCLSLSAIANDGTNLISNPGFEDGKKEWGLFVPSAHEGMYSEFIVSSEDPHSGAACAEMRADQPIRYALTAFGGKKHAVVPKERYRISAWVRFSDD